MSVVFSNLSAVPIPVTAVTGSVEGAPLSLSVAKRHATPLILDICRTASESSHKLSGSLSQSGHPQHYPQPHPQRASKRRESHPSHVEVAAEHPRRVSLTTPLEYGSDGGSSFLAQSMLDDFVTKPSAIGPIRRAIGKAQEDRRKRRVITQVMHSDEHWLENDKDPIRQQWELLAPDSNDALPYRDVDLLLRLFYVEMDHCSEIEFYHRLDPDHTGLVQFEGFASTFQLFKQERRFLEFATDVQISCVVATQGGMGAEKVTEAWQAEDREGAQFLGAEGIASVLRTLGFHHTDAQVLEFVGKMGDPVPFSDFLELFEEKTKDEEEEKYEAWMEQVHKVLAAREHMSVVRSEQQKYAAKLEKAHDWYMNTFLWVLFLYAQVNATVPIFLFCFDDPWVVIEVPKRTGLMTILLLSDVVMWFQIISQFYLPKEVSGAPVYRAKDIRTIYLTSKEFYIDLFVALPFDLLVGIVYADGFLHPLFRLNKLLVLYYIYKWFSRLWSGVFGPRWWRIVNALYWWALLGHLVACIFHTIAMTTGDTETKIVLTVPNYSTLSTLHQYLQDLSYAINTMAGLSRGFFPNHDKFALFSMFVTMVGVFVYALLLAVVALGLSILDHEGKFNAHVEDIQAALFGDLQSGRIPQTFLQEVIAYHKHVFYSTGQIMINEDLLADLPSTLQASLDLVTGRDTIGRVQILSAACSEDEFVYALEQCLQIVVFPPGCNVIEAGEDGREMYFIRCGTCEVVVGGEVQALLGAGDLFGEIALLADVARTATIRTATFCNLLVLTREDFELVSSSFPQLRRRIEEEANTRIIEMMACAEAIKDPSNSSNSRPLEVSWRGMNPEWDNSFGNFGNGSQGSSSNTKSLERSRRKGCSWHSAHSPVRSPRGRPSPSSPRSLNVSPNPLTNSTLRMRVTLSPVMAPTDGPTFDCPKRQWSVSAEDLVVIPGQDPDGAQGEESAAVPPEDTQRQDHPARLLQPTRSPLSPAKTEPPDGAKSGAKDNATQNRQHGREAREESLPTPAVPVVPTAPASPSDEKPLDWLRQKMTTKAAIQEVTDKQRMIACMIRNRSCKNDDDPGSAGRGRAVSSSRPG